MTSDLFKIYLQCLNNHVDRKILLLIDNAPSHIWKELELSNLEIISLPPNTTSKLQPLDAGIIMSFKCHYHHSQMQYALDQLDQGIDPYKVNQLQAMRWTKSAWNDIPQSVFINCWKHTGLLPNPDDSMSATEVNSNSDLDPVQAEVHTEFDQFIKASDIAEPVLFEEFINPAT